MWASAIHRGVPVPCMILTPVHVCVSGVVAFRHDLIGRRHGDLARHVFDGGPGRATRDIELPVHSHSRVAFTGLRLGRTDRRESGTDASCLGVLYVCPRISIEIRILVVELPRRVNIRRSFLVGHCDGRRRLEPTRPLLR